MAGLTGNIPVGQIRIFIITGVDKYGKRFQMSSSSYMQAMMYNIWRGSVWAELENGKRKLLKRVYN